MIRYFAGIDPGLQGALVLLNEKGSIVDIRDTPTILVKGKKHKNTYLEVEMHKILTEFSKYSTDIHVGIESQASRPGQGAPATFSQGYGFGLWIMAIAALRLPYTRIPPQTWKKAIGIPPKSDKAASAVRALQLFPQADLLKTARSRVPADGRADALLIAEFTRRTIVTKSP